MVAGKSMSKPISRIGSPPPQRLPVVLHRKPDSELARMSVAQLKEHLRHLSDDVEKAMAYQEEVLDRILIRRDLEQPTPRLRAEDSA